MTYKRIIKKTAKILAYILGSLVVLVCLLLIFINLPVGKRVVRNEVQSYLQGKLKTKVSIGSIDYSLPKWLELNNIYIEDQKKDTLIFGERISVNISMLKLIWGDIDIQKVGLENILVNIKRAENDTSFNYQFIVNAFSGSSPPPSAKKDTAALKLKLDRLLLDRISLRYIDKKEGTDFYAGIKNLDVALNKFQPDKLEFGIKDFVASGVDFLMTTYKESIKETNSTTPVNASEDNNTDLKITAAAFNVRDMNVAVEDKISGMYYGNKVTHLGLSKVFFNLAGLVAKADELLLDSSYVKFVNPKTATEKNPPKNETTSVNTGGSWDIQAKQVSLSNNIFRYDDNNLPQSGGLDFGHLHVKDLTADINEFIFSGARTSALVKQLRFKDTSGFALDTTHVNFLITDSVISAKELYVKTPQSLLQNFAEIKFEGLSQITSNPRDSRVAATLKNSTIAFNDLYLLVPALKKSFPPEQFANNKVFFNTELRGNLAQLYLPYLQLVGFSGSRLNAHGSLFNLTDVNKFYYDLYIDNGIIKKSDLLKFVPKENQESLVSLPDIINIKGRITGNQNDLVSDIITTGKGMAINGRFSLKNFTDPVKMKLDFAIRNSSFDKDFILKLIPPGTLSPEIKLPEKNYVTGTLTGDLNNLVADLKLDGSYGLITVKGFVKDGKDPLKASYDLDITTTKYEIGKLISQDSLLGKVTGSFKLKGTGFDYKTMKADVTASVKDLQFKNYNYQNADIAANFNSGIINSKGSINDTNLKMEYDIKADLQHDYPSLNGFVKVDTAQLQKLNLYDDTLNFSLRANIAANNLQPRHLDINTLIESVKMQVGKKYYSVDSIAMVATSANGIDDIHFNAPFADLHAQGGFDYDKIGDAVIQYVNHYYKLSDSIIKKDIPDQQLVFDGTIKKHPLITTFIPGLKDYNDIVFSGSFTSAEIDSALNLKMSVPYLAYDDYVVANGKIDLSSDKERMNYHINLDTLNYSKRLFYGTGLNGSIISDSVLIHAFTKDSKNKDWFGLKASFFARDGKYFFHLKDKLLLNYENWNIASDNYVKYSTNGLIVHDFLITSDTSKIFINSREEIANSPIDIDIEKFNLKSISSILNQDTVFLSGIVDAKMEVADLDKKLPAFTGFLTITDLAVKQQPFGKVTALAEKRKEDNILIILDLKGNGNDVAAVGNYYLNNSQQQFNVTANITKFNVAEVQAFSGKEVNNASGNIFGNIKASGRFDDPRWEGELNFDTAKFTITKLGTAFKIDKQKIVFEYPEIKLDNFIITDSLNNQLKIDGVVKQDQAKGFSLDLGINANDFILLNAPKSANSQFYGLAVADMNIKLTGDLVSPDIQGSINVKDRSDIVIVIPESNYSKDEGKAIVRFIDRDTFDLKTLLIPFTEKEETGPAFAQFLNYNLNVEVQKKAALTIIIDPVTGDEINVQGAASLNAGVDPGGHIILSGNYELSSGYYVFNYQFLKRKFTLEKGSTIMFAGDPIRARMDIIASYTVKSAAKDLIGNEVGSVDPSLANSFNQKIPFKVILYLTGTISKPTLKFDIELASENASISSDLKTTIENKLVQIRADESSTNKQVFSLLLLNKFIGEQSSDFFKGAGNEFDDLARQSVSHFLSAALNEIAESIFTGVDIDLNLNNYKDYNSGGSTQRTDLAVALSKSFFDDRLTVSVGKNFGFQGHDGATNSNNNYIPDVTLGYKLSKDGRYLLKAYRKSQFEVVMDGYIVETGLGFVVTMDFDKFNELFGRKKKK